MNTETNKLKWSYVIKKSDEKLPKHALSKIDQFNTLLS